MAEQPTGQKKGKKIELFVIKERGGLYWRPKAQGYTRYLHEAGLFDADSPYVLGCGSRSNADRGDIAIPAKTLGKEALETANACVLWAQRVMSGTSHDRSVTP